MPGCDRVRPRRLSVAASRVVREPGSLGGLPGLLSTGSRIAARAERGVPARRRAAPKITGPLVPLSAVHASGIPPRGLGHRRVIGVGVSRRSRGAVARGGAWLRACLISVSAEQRSLSVSSSMMWA